MGRNSETKTVKFHINGKEEAIEVETFTWEKLDCQDETRTAFGL
jgi:hypothetical protein